MAQSPIWKARPQLDESKWKITKLGGGKGFTATRKAKANPLAGLKNPGTVFDPKELPSTFVNRTGVVGGWKSQPANMNPNDWEFATNRAGRTFARPVDEFTGLDDGVRRQVNTFDADTRVMGDYLAGRTEVAGNQANADAKAAADRMASLTALGAGGGNPELAAAGAKLQLAQAALAGRDDNRGVGLARDAAETRLAQYRAARNDSRFGMLNSARESQAAAAAAQAKADYEQSQDAKSLAAQLRGQDMQLLGQRLSIQGQNDRAELSANTSLTNNQTSNQTRLQIAAARLEAQAVKDEAAGRQKAAETKRKKAEAKRKQDRQEKSAYASNLRRAGVAMEKIISGDAAYTFSQVSTMIQRQFPQLKPWDVNQMLNDYFKAYTGGDYLVNGGYGPRLPPND